MKLSVYLSQKNITPAQFAQLLGVKSRMTVHRYLSGDRIPNKRCMSIIEEVTHGEVTRADFPSHKTVTVVRSHSPSMRPVFPWSRMSAEEQAHQQQAFEKMMTEPPEGYTHSTVINRAIKVLGERVTVKGVDDFRLDNRPTGMRYLIKKANEILQAQGSQPLKYPGVNPITDPRPPQF